MNLKKCNCRGETKREETVHLCFATIRFRFSFAWLTNSATRVRLKFITLWFTALVTFSLSGRFKIQKIQRLIQSWRSIVRQFTGAWIDQAADFESGFRKFVAAEDEWNRGSGKLDRFCLYGVACIVTGGRKSEEVIVLWIEFVGRLRFQES